jgi:hypothetical protein
MSDDENKKEEARPEILETNGNNTISPEKLAANRANGKRSAGPTTPEGKARSSQNSRKHGFFARQPLPPGEEGAKLWQAYGDLVAGIWEYYQPVGYMEGLLTEKIVTESIRFSRLLAFESEYVGKQRALHWSGIDRILRFQGAINRQLFQAMRELERLQDRRRATPTKDSGHTSDNGSPGPSLADENPNHQPKGGPRAEGTLENPMNEVPDPSQWGPIPMSLPPATSNLGQASRSSPQVPNYGTNPTSASSKQTGGIAPSDPPKPPKETLAERATKALGLPPMESPAEKSSATPEQGGRTEQQDNTDDIPHRSKFIAPGDEASFKQVQESTRREEDPEDSS